MSITFRSLSLSSSGKADKPVWIDIRNSEVTIRDAAGLWGKDTWATQQEIWDFVGARRGAKNVWQDLRDFDGDENSKKDEGRSTQKPVVLCIGPAGENQTCHGCLIHDAGNGAGQGGFGAVWGSKNLKAISVLGTGSIKVADPQALIRPRIITKEKYVSSWERPDFRSWSRLGGFPRPIIQVPGDRRPVSSDRKAASSA